MIGLGSDKNIPSPLQLSCFFFIWELEDQVYCFFDYYLIVGKSLLSIFVSFVPCIFLSLSVYLNQCLNLNKNEWTPHNHKIFNFYQLYHTSNNASFGIWSSFLSELISWSIAVRSLLECPGPLWFRNPTYSDHFKAVQGSSQILSLMKKLIERKLPFSRISKPYIRLNSGSLVKFVHY